MLTLDDKNRLAKNFKGDENWGAQWKRGEVRLKHAGWEQKGSTPKGAGPFVFIESR